MKLQLLYVCIDSQTCFYFGSAPVQLSGSRPEAIPLSQNPAPGLPSYSDALNRSGQYDAPPPPYSGYVCQAAWSLLESDYLQYVQGISHAFAHKSLVT